MLSVLIVFQHTDFHRLLTTTCQYKQQMWHTEKSKAYTATIVIVIPVMFFFYLRDLKKKLHKKNVMSMVKYLAHFLKAKMAIYWQVQLFSIAHYQLKTTCLNQSINICKQI